MGQEDNSLLIQPVIDTNNEFMNNIIQHILFIPGVQEKMFHEV